MYQSVHVKPFQIGSVAEAIESIQKSYAPCRDLQTGKPTSGAGKPNTDCEFATIMYNRKQGDFMQQDPLLIGASLEKAEQENLDPAHFYPVCELGIDALSRRVENQNTEVTKCNEQIKSLSEIITSIDQSDTQISVKVNDLKTRQTKLLQKLLGVMRKVEILRCHGAELQQPEQMYRERLTRIMGAMRGPYSELNELTKVEHKSDAALQPPSEQYAGAESLSEEDLEFMTSALQRQREGLEYITEILIKDVRDVGIIRDGLKQQQQDAIEDAKQ